MAIVVVADPGPDVIAAGLDLSTTELVERDRFLQPVRTWAAHQDREPIGLATAYLRPDRRLFITIRVRVETAFRPLLEAATADLEPEGQPHLTVGAEDGDRLLAAVRIGFEPVSRTTAFSVPFASALERSAKGGSRRLHITTADDVDPDQLFALDTELRCDVPGSDGWQGNRTWFDDELASAAYDPAAYTVAQDPADGRLVGLCRFWNNPDGPTLGMIGVRRGYRTGRPALALLHQALVAASGWGYPTFSTHTARGPLQRRLRAIGAEEIGGTLILARPRPG